MDRFAKLISYGVGGFYWDSLLCPGRATFEKDTRKRWPTLFVMGEAGADVDSIFVGHLPWYSHDNWQPPFEPDNSAIARLVLPGSTAFEGLIGGDNFLNHTLATLQNSISTSLIGFGPRQFNWSSANGAASKSDFCHAVQLSYNNAVARGERYPLTAPGAQEACPALVAPDLAAFDCNNQ